MTRENQAQAHPTVHLIVALDEAEEWRASVDRAYASGLPPLVTHLTGVGSSPKHAVNSYRKQLQQQALGLPLPELQFRIALPEALQQELDDYFAEEQTLEKLNKDLRTKQRGIVRRMGKIRVPRSLISETFGLSPPTIKALVHPARFNVALGSHD